MEADAGLVSALREDLNAQAGDLVASASGWLDDACLDRYLRARKGHVKKAAQLLVKTLEWRAKIDIGSLKVQDFEAEILSGKMYIHGRDSDGRSIMINRKKADAFKPGQNEQYLRHLAFTLETACRSMGKGQESWIWIMDLNGMTRANSPPLSVSMATLHILADCYPERLHKCFVVDAPAVFGYLWVALSPFIDSVTKQKVVFVKSTDWRETMEKRARENGDGLPPESGDDFGRYWQAYCSVYSETAFRELLGKCGWQ